MLRRIAALFNGSLFSCQHPRRAWPLSQINGKPVPPYEACLDCGAELPWIGAEERPAPLGPRVMRRVEEKA